MSKGASVIRNARLARTMVAMAILTSVLSGFRVVEGLRDADGVPRQSRDTLAQFSTAGVITDAATGRPIEGVAISATLAGTSRVGTATSAVDGSYRVSLTRVARGSSVIVSARRLGYEPAQQTLTIRSEIARINLALSASPSRVSELASRSDAPKVRKRDVAGATIDIASAPAPATIAKGAVNQVMPLGVGPRQMSDEMRRNEGDKRGRREDKGWDREQYDRVTDNPFLGVRGNPRSTFSIDVDRASYGNVRRYLSQGQLPPADAVRIEELVNYFPYALAEPRAEAPVAITTEAMPAPWQLRHQLVRIALQARRIRTENLPPSNLVFLIDVSGSMQSPDKLPLVKQSLGLLVEQLRPQDRVAMVVYAGAAGLVLPSTAGNDKARIMEAIERLEAGGSTAGGAGLELAYRTAREHFERGGNNRVILATDGDFNVGPSSDAAMERLIESKRAEGTYLTVLGYGTGNYQDAKMQKMAKIGNGNAAYIDDLAEANKVLVKEMGGTLFTVANDVKLQIEFNPSRVSAYRLIGYEDRLLRDEDFKDDKKDAGDMGAGHSVTALYEVVPVGVTGTVTIRDTDPLRYTRIDERDAPLLSASDELLHVSLRYKRPGESTSTLITQAVRARDGREHASEDFRFAASVASFGMLLRNSEHKGNATGAQTLGMARAAMGDDEGGYRHEFVRLIERWQEISRGIAVRPERDR